MYMCVSTRVCRSVLSQSWISQEKMPFVVEGERDHRARETPEKREARLSQRRLRDRERKRERLGTETVEDREARLATRRVQAKSRLSAKSGERSSNTSEAKEKGELLHSPATRQRLCRGVAWIES